MADDIESPVARIRYDEAKCHSHLRDVEEWAGALECISDHMLLDMSNVPSTPDTVDLGVRLQHVHGIPCPELIDPMPKKGFVFEIVADLRTRADALKVAQRKLSQLLEVYRAADD